MQVRRVEAVIAEVATAHHGVVARRQLLARGVSDDEISGRVERGYLQVLHRGVYAVGHSLLTAKGRFAAAVLAGGEHAVLSHQSAAQLWELRVPGTAVHVTVRSARRSRRGLVFHEARPRPDEITVLDGVPVTTVARTLLDLAAALPPFRVEKALREAEYRRLADTPSLPQLIARYPGRRGLATLRRILHDGLPVDAITRSDLEDRFIAFLRERRLPLPELNVSLDLGGVRVEVDCLWREYRLVVELDGRAAHERSASFESDRLRDRHLLTCGWRPTRVTWHHLHSAPDDLDRALGRLLA